MRCRDDGLVGDVLVWFDKLIRCGGENTRMKRGSIRNWVERGV